MPAHSRILDFLAEVIARGPSTIGQIRVNAGFSLHHVEDHGKGDLRVFHTPGDARRLAIYDDAGVYRPLKTAPNLRRGWRLDLPDLADVRLALDYFYPAALGTLVSHAAGEVLPVPMRDTLARQTGMYRVVGKLTDGQAIDLVARTCTHAGGCLRQILWPIAPGLATPDQGALPLSCEGGLPIYCVEACNLLVAAGRRVVKGTSGQSPPEE